MDVVILGRIGYDLCSEEPHVPLAQVRRFSRYLGGSSANIAVGLARLGLRVGMVSCLGTDPLSQFLADFLHREGVDTSRVKRVPGLLPSLALTEVSPPDRFPQVFYRQDPADAHLEAEPEDLDYVAGARMFLTNGTALCASPSRESAYRALERAHAAGRRVAFDVDYRWMSWRRPEEAGLASRLALPLVDVLLANEAELELVAGLEGYERALEALRRRVPLVVAKLGERGTRVCQGEQDFFLPPYRVQVVSTIGAGDGFAAGFLYALLAGKPLEECLHYGNAAAAVVVSRLSCSEAMPTPAEIEQLIAERRTG